MKYLGLLVKLFLKQKEVKHLMQFYLHKIKFYKITVTVYITFANITKLQ